MFKKDFHVKVEHSAREMGSGDLDVLSTPFFNRFYSKHSERNRAW